ncbi:hypothetical protein KKF91_20600 [Myxococcota bacterium]|nr:hypothetical protein [Myxococcota bacterium]MBU1432946.1 hypothetical protein [Myxococcota bacterium]MBU1896248.1 hypothetical protein [Myxococcota bacterium]
MFSAKRNPSRLHEALLLTLILAPRLIYAADDVSPDLLTTYNEVMRKAERVLAEKGDQAAIDIYEDALLTYGEYGRVNLRLGQLYQKLGREVEAAKHYKICIEDERVDPLDRNMICERRFQTVTAPLELSAVPNEAKIIVIEPALFGGEIQSGVRLPIGEIKLMVEVPGHYPQESTIKLEGPMTWRVVKGLSRREGRVVPDGFVDGTPPKGDGVGPDPFLGEPPAAPKAIRWPAYTALGLGAALVGVGLYQGFDNRAALDDVRAQQLNGGCGRGFCDQGLADAQNTAVLADALWISGATVAASSVLLWYLFDVSPQEAP